MIKEYLYFNSDIDEEKRNKFFYKYETLIRYSLDSGKRNAEIEEINKLLDGLMEETDFIMWFHNILLEKKNYDYLNKFVKYYSLISKMRELERLYDFKMKEEKFKIECNELLTKEPGLKEILIKLSKKHENTIDDNLIKIVRFYPNLFHVRKRFNGKEVVALSPEARRIVKYIEEIG